MRYSPYFAQALYYLALAPEQIPSAIERYRKETLRVLSVLDSVLSKQEWLMGGKLTVADLSFVMWNHDALNIILKDYAEANVEKDYPAFYA